MSEPWRRRTRRRSRALAAAVGAAAAIGLSAASAGAAERLAGNVLSVDADAQRVTIIDAGRRHTFAVGPETAIRQGGTNRQLADLRRGDRIVVTLSSEVAGEATTIAIAGPGRLVSGGAAVPGFASGLNARTLPPR